MHENWTSLSDELQLLLSREALIRAVSLVARQAEALAGEMEIGMLADKGGADALRLFAAVVRANEADMGAVAGHC